VHSSKCTLVALGIGWVWVWWFRVGWLVRVLGVPPEKLPLDGALRRARAAGRLLDDMRGFVSHQSNIV
jgi:hypothetical protein